MIWRNTIDLVILTISFLIDAYYYQVLFYYNLNYFYHLSLLRFSGVWLLTQWVGDVYNYFFLQIIESVTISYSRTISEYIIYSIYNYNITHTFYLIIQFIQLSMTDIISYGSKSIIQYFRTFLFKIRVWTVCQCTYVKLCWFFSIC